MTERLSGLKVAVLATDGFEQSELEKPVAALKAEGAEVAVVSPKDGEIRGWDMTDWGRPAHVDEPLRTADAGAFDALVLPGGVMNPDKLRLEPRAIEFVRTFAQADKPIAAICHGPWTLINAEAVAGKTMTSWPSLETDLENAGADWVDREVVVDGRLVTSRKPDDLPAFCEKMIETFARGPRPGAGRSAGAEGRPAAP